MKRSIKKSISLLISFCMLCMCMVSTAFASDGLLDIDVEVSGGYAVMTVSVEKSAGVAGATVKMTYDTEYLTLVDIQSYNFDAETDEEEAANEAYVEAYVNSCLTDPEDGTPADAGKINISCGEKKAVEGIFFVATFSLDKGTYSSNYFGFTEYSVANKSAEVLETLDTVIPAVDYVCAHDTTTSVVIEEATCEKDGSQDVTCSVCGKTYTETIPATGHTWGEGEVTTAATCTEDGVLTYTCTVCGATKTEVIEATGHTWDDGVVTKEATETENGVKTYTCTVCGETYTEEIAYSADEGDTNYVVVLAAFAMIALAGCAVANKKSTY